MRWIRIPQSERRFSTASCIYIGVDKRDHSSKFLPTLHPMRTRPDGAHGPYTPLYVFPYYLERTNAA